MPRSHGEPAVPAPDPSRSADLREVAFDLSPSGMLAVDGTGRIVAVNREAERLFGWTREELIGQPIEVLVPDRYRAVHPHHRATFMHGPSSRPMGAGRELHARRRDGSEFPVEIGLNPIHTRHGDFALASIVDITARRQLDEDLRRTQKLETIGILAGGIAHDFNNILMGIVGHTELALRDGQIGVQGREDLGHVLQAAERGRQLVRRIMAFSRDAEMSRKPMHLERVIEEVIALLRASLPSTIEIATEIEPQMPPVQADETQIHQVLLNLATNAAHAMPAGGRLGIRLASFSIAPDASGTPPGVYARLIVSDTGEGMPPEVLEHAIEPFFTTKPPGQGTGLGLSVVHGIVTSHLGFMAIASEAGRGTTITIDLPAGVARDPVGESAAREIAPPRRLRILFVEDEPVLALMQKRQLEHFGFEVIAHTSSQEALADFRARPDAFQLVITDDTMPGMTGSALCREIVAIRPEMPVLMVSGGDRSDPSRPRPAGVRRVLRKPHTAAELEQAIREVLEPTSTSP